MAIIKFTFFVVVAGTIIIAVYTRIYSIESASSFIYELGSQTVELDRAIQSERVQ